MKTILIYDAGEKYEPDIRIREFQDSTEMITFINTKIISSGIIAAYECYKEINIEPFEKVTAYRIKK